MKKLLRLTLIVSIAGALFGVATHLLSAHARYENTSDLPAQIGNLQQMADVLESASDAGTILFHAGLSNEALDKLAAAVVGIEVELPQAANARIRLSQLALRSSPGELRATLELIGTSPGLDGEVALSGNGVVLFDHFETPAGDAVTQAVYRVHLEHVEPAFRLGWFTFGASRWANELLRSTAIDDLGAALQFRVPVPQLPEIDFGFVREDTTFIEDTGANYVVRAELPRTRLSAAVELRTPIPSHDGLHILGTRVGRTPHPSDAATDADTALQTQRDDLLSRVAALSERLPQLTSPVSLTVYRNLLGGIVDQVNALPQAGRTVTYQLVSWHGRLVDEIHEADIVGKGGYYVEFDTKDSASGRVRIDALQSQWSEQGLVLTSTVSADANARLNVYIDPYIGGGFDFDMGIAGSAQAPLALTLAARKVATADGTAFLFGPVIQCTQVPITVEGGGSVKFGVKMYELMGEEPLRPTVLLTSDAYRAPLLANLDGPALRHRASYVQLTVTPLDIEILADAYRFKADLDVTRHDGELPPPAPSELPDTRIAAYEAEWDRTMSPACPAKSPSKFLFAGEEFGPNNEITKALQRIGRAAELAKHNTEVAWDDVETVVKDPTQAPAKAKEILKRTGRELERAGDRVERDVLKPAEKVVRKVLRKLRF